jgi:hypothetical protein
VRAHPAAQTGVLENHRGAHRTVKRKRSTWGIRPHSIGGWLAFLGVSLKEFERLAKMRPARRRSK